jgi:cell division septal protein FtsQ
MSKTTKILSLLFLAVTLMAVLYLSIALNNGTGYKIQIISLDGNIHLSKEQYLSYANLVDKNLYSNLSLQVIKDRIEKHPYVECADVRYEGDNQISIRITEKTFDSILINEDNQFILTEDLQVLPVFPQTKKIDYPIISNPAFYGKLKVFARMKDNLDIITASKIITAVKLLNPELYDSLSTIDMKYGGEIVVYLTTVNYPIEIGRGNEIRKISYLNTLWNYLKGKEINQYLDYVDLRFSGHLYLGITKSQTSTDKNEEQKKSKAEEATKKT